MIKKRKKLMLTELAVEAPSLGARELSPAELTTVAGARMMAEGGTSTESNDFDGDGTCTSFEDYD